MTRQQLEEIRKLWSEGVKSHLIGGQFGVSGAYIRTLAMRHKFGPRINNDRRTSLCREFGVTGVCDIPEYSNWVELKRRAQRPRKQDMRSYVEHRRVTLDPRWEDFTNFYRDMGPKPSDAHSVDRIDNELGYGPGNCRWATMQEQSNNRRTTRWVEWGGVRMSFADAVRAAGVVDRKTAEKRCYHGWPLERAITEPAQTNKQRAAARRGARKRVAPKPKTLKGLTS